jgi:hypothetical protein
LPTIVATCSPVATASVSVLGVVSLSVIAGSS